MPIARRPGYATALGSYIAPPEVVVPAGGLSAGIAVAIVDVGGVSEYRPCGALPADWADCLVGFLYMDAEAGGRAKIMVGRGSIVQPLVEGAVSLVPNVDVYLSTVPGRVTQTNLNVATMRRIKLGHAISTTQMALVTDMRYVMAG